jgi:5-methylcytosine-specific restriction endonuclease McrA
MRHAEFSNATKLAAWRRAGGKCEQCGTLVMGKGHFDHIRPCAFNGDNGVDNCQLLCVEHHRQKTATQDIPAIAKSNRVRLRHAGIKPDRTIRAWRKLDRDRTPVFKPKER